LYITACLSLSKFVVGQKLHLIVNVVKEDAGMKLVTIDRAEVDSVFLFIAVALLENGCLVGKVDSHAYDVALDKLERLKSDGNYLEPVILVDLGIAPAASVGADHVGPVSDVAEVEAVALADDQVLVAHAHSHPVGGRFLDLEAHLLDLLPRFQAGLHDSELIP
jgi:hypothetical protein